VTCPGWYAYVVGVELTLDHSVVRCTLGYDVSENAAATIGFTIVDTGVYIDGLHGQEKNDEEDEGLKAHFAPHPRPYSESWL